MQDTQLLENLFISAVHRMPCPFPGASRDFWIALCAIWKCLPWNGASWKLLITRTPTCPTLLSSLLNAIKYIAPHVRLHHFLTVSLCSSTGITVDKFGLIYFVDGTMIRRIDQNGIISTVLGSNDLTSARPLSCDSVMDISQVRQWFGFVSTECKPTPSPYLHVCELP